jgi:hypothetical protein
MRFTILLLSTALLCAGISNPGYAKAAVAAAAVTETEASGGIKSALAQGVKTAIGRLGKTDGFFADQLVRIALPKKVQRLADAARALGAGSKVDAFELSLNRAAEKAVPLAADVFADAVKQLSVQDALSIVRGDADAGTQFFRRVTEEKLREKFLPVVSKATSEVGVTQRYKELTGKSAVSKLFGKQDDVNLDQYVTNKALDGLYFYVADEEKKIRSNPMQQGTNLLRRVFGGKL